MVITRSTSSSVSSPALLVRSMSAFLSTTWAYLRPTPWNYRFQSLNFYVSHIGPLFKKVCQGRICNNGVRHHLPGHASLTHFSGHKAYRLNIKEGTSTVASWVKLPCSHPIQLPAYLPGKATWVPACMWETRMKLLACPAPAAVAMWGVNWQIEDLCLSLTASQIK